MGVAVAWLSNKNIIRLWYCALLSTLSFSIYASPPNVTKIEEQRFCKRHKVLNLNQYLDKEDGSIFAFLAATKNSLQKISARSLLPDFHPKLNTKLADLDKLMQRMKYVLGAPLEVSLFRLWEIANPNEGIEGLLCDEDKTYKVNPHYGYKQQYIAWFGVLGRKELGRLFVTIVKNEGKWNFGFFHFHKWTHMEKDYEAWIKDGNEDILGKLDMAAYIKYSVAQKLLAGNPHFQIEKRLELDRFIKENVSKEEWLSNIRNIFSGQTILTADSVFAGSGVGVMIRFEIKKELSTVQIREHCTNQLEKLKKLTWFSSIDGIKCSYVVLGEPKDKEGQLGSIYLEKSSA